MTRAAALGALAPGLGLAYRALAMALCLCAVATGAASAPRQTLVIAAFPSVDDVIRSAIPRWKLLHPGVEVRVLSRSFEDHHTVMVTALSTATHLPDVMAVEVGYLGRFADGARLTDLSLPPYRIKEQRAHYVPFAFAQATTRSGAVLAAPADIGPGTLLYRSDLLKAAGVSEAELTQSWESFIAAGLKIKAATGASLLPHARNLAEILVRAGLKPGQGQYFDASGAVLVETPRFVHAFEMARRVRELHLDANQTSWTGGWVDALKGGHIASIMAGAWMAGHLSTWVAPQTQGRWRATQLPQNTWSTWGGSFYTLPQGGKNKQLAWEFIQFMTQDRDMQLAAFKSQNAFPAMVDTYGDAFFEQPLEFFGGQQARLVWRDAVARVADAGVHELDLEARIIVSNELSKVLDQNKDIALALHDARLTLERLARDRALRP